MNITLQIGDRVMIKQRKLNKLTPIFQPTPYIVIYTKGILIKTKAENSNCIVTRNILHFRRIPKDAVFPYSTSDDDFEYSRHDNNDNHNQNNRRYTLRIRKPPCQYGTTFEHKTF